MVHPIDHQIQVTSFIEMCPPEILIKIFGSLDSESLIRISGVCKLFEQLQKDNALWIIPFGSTRWDKCVLDLRDKTITIESPWPGIRHCVPAMNHPAVPKGSFVVFLETNTPCAVIKDRNGLVESDATIAQFRPKPITIEFRKHVGTPTKYVRFMIIAPNPTSMKEGYINGQQEIALKALEQCSFALNNLVKEYHKPKEQALLKSH